jgi:hypothetical protein
MTRRQMFADSLLGALGIAPVASEGPGRPDSLEWLMDRYGETTVAQQVATMVDMQELRRRVRATAQRERRQSESRHRREVNEDVVLYRGPALWGDLDFAGREVQNRYHRRVQVGTTPTNLCLGQHQIPAGSKILVDCRHGMPMQLSAEIVQSRQGVRLHLMPWKGSLDPTRPLKAFQIVS